MLVFSVVLCLAVIVPGLLAPGADASLRLVWSELFGLAALSAVVASGSNLTPGPFLRLTRPRPAALVLGALLGVAGMAVAEGLAIPWVAILPRGMLERFDVGRLFDQPPWERLAIAVAASTVAPLCEELAFRGYLLSALGLRRRPAVAIALSALVFALIHLDPVRFPAVLFLGLLYGWIAWRTGSVWPSALAHVVNNGIVSAVALAGGGGRLADAAPTREAIGAAIELGAGAVVLLTGLALGLAHLTAPPPPVACAVLRDPTDPGDGFRFARVPPGLALAVPAGLLSLALLVLAGWWRAG